MGKVKDLTAQWEQDEALVRARHVSGGAGCGLTRPEQVVGKSGLQVFQEVLQGLLPYPPIGDTLDFMVVEVESGRAVFQGRPSERHYNPLGTVHGGWYAAMLDSAAGCAIHAALPAGKLYTTLELKVNMVRPLTRETPLVRAEGTVIHLGGQVATSEARLVGPDGRLYAHATSTCLIFDYARSKHATTGGGVGA